jgi:hypothetical protein
MSILKAYGVCLYVQYEENYKILLCQSIDNQINGVSSKVQKGEMKLQEKLP